MRPGLTPWQVIDLVWDWCAGDAIVVSDTGAHKFLVGQLWRTKGPRSFFVSNGLSSMGYALPTAAAACMLQNDRPVVAFVGDGGLAMFLGELGTLTRLELNLLVVVFVDGSLELIRRAQHARHLLEAGTAFDNPDLRQIAGAYGLRGQLVRSRDQLSLSLQTARQPGVHLVAASVDGRDYRL